MWGRVVCVWGGVLGGWKAVGRRGSWLSSMLGEAARLYGLQEQEQEPTCWFESRGPGMAGIMLWQWHSNVRQRIDLQR